MSIVVASPKHARRCRTADVWAYIGADANRRGWIAQLLGAERQISVAASLRRAAMKHRDEFIGWVAAIGQNQPDSVRWWARRFASRSPYMDDAFALACFAVVCGELFDRYRNDPRNVAIFIEDPWLYAALQRSHADGGINFQANAAAPLIGAALKCVLRGAGGRLRLAFQVIRQWARLRSKPPHQRTPSRASDCWVYSMAEPRSFVGTSGVRDACMPGLDALLERRGVKAHRLLGSAVVCGDCLAPVSERLGSMLPLALCLRWRDLLKALAAFSRMEGAIPPGPDGADLRWLARRQDWLELGSANLSVNVLTYWMFRQFFRTHAGHCLFHFYEGQPWEKLMRLARDKEGSAMALAGYQHSTVPRLLLSYFPHPAEWATAPHPDRVVTTGPFHKDLFERSGYPKGLVADGGSLRYSGTRTSAAGRTGKADGRETLVFAALPIDPYIAREMLDLLAQHTEIWIRNSISFSIKAHPARPVDEVQRICERGACFRATTAVLADAAPDLVVYSCTTVGIEAARLGLPVIAYLPEGRLPLDPGDWFPELIETCTRDDFQQRVLEIAAHGRVPGTANVRWEDLWAPVDEEQWMELAGRPAVARAQP